MPTSATTSPCPAIRDIMALEMGPAFRARWATLRSQRFLDSMQLFCSALDGYLCSGCLDDDACRESLNSFIYYSVLKTFTREKKLVRALDVGMELRVGELDVSIVIFSSCSCS